MHNNKKKNAVSINVCVGQDLFDMLTDFCAITGQSKTVAIERAISTYCSDDSDNDNNDLVAANN